MTTPNLYKRVNFDRCDHKLLGTCAAPVGGCCAVVACAICLRLFRDIYPGEEVPEGAEPISSGRADFQEDGYRGGVDGAVTFEGYWVADYVTGDCKFIVTITDIFDTQVFEFSKCGGDPEASCLTPEGSALVTYKSELVTLIWEPLDIVTLRHRAEYSEDCIGVDLAVVLDSSQSIAPTLAELQSNIAAVINAVIAVTDDYQFALHTFKDAVTHNVAFSPQNDTAFLAAIAGLTAEGGDNAPEASDYALQASVSQSGWRAGARKIIILVTDNVAGGLNDIADPEDEARLFAAATAAGNDGKFLLTVRSGPNTAAVTQLQTAASLAGGKYLSTADNLSAEIAQLVRELCQHITCKHPFCGTCTCAPRELCVKLLVEDCAAAGIAKKTTLYCIEEDEISWDFSVSCQESSELAPLTVTGTISLVPEDYTHKCLLLVDVPMFYETFIVEITECKDLDGGITITHTGLDGRDYSLEITASDCNDCRFRIECCDDAEVPPTLSIRMFAVGLNRIGPGQTQADYERIDRDGSLTYEFGNFLFSGFIPGATWDIDNATGDVIDIDLYVHFSCGGPGTDVAGTMRTVAVWRAKGPTYNGPPAEYPDEWLQSTHPDFSWGEGDLDVEGLLFCDNGQFIPAGGVDWELTGASDPPTWPRMFCTCEPITAWGTTWINSPVLVTELDMGEVSTYPWESVA